MQFTLSSLLISFAVVAAAMAAFGPGTGIGTSVVLVGSVAILRNARRPWRAGLIVGCALVVGVVAIVWMDGWQNLAESLKPYQDPRRLRCQHNMKGIGVILECYRRNRGQYLAAYAKGPDGRPWHSWRVLIAPYGCTDELYNSYHSNEPWDGPNNCKLIDLWPSFYVCSQNNRFPKTNYLAVIGPDAAWPGETSRKGDEISDPGNTIQVVEVADSGISWMEPRDITLEEVIRAKEAGGPSSIFNAHPDHLACVAMSDGTTRLLPDTLSSDELRALLTVGADKTTAVKAIETGMAKIEFVRTRNFCIQMAVLVGATLVLLLRPNPRWKKQPLPTEAPAPAAE